MAGHDVGSIARVASAALAASFKSACGKVFRSLICGAHSTHTKPPVSRCKCNEMCGHWSTER